MAVVTKEQWLQAFGQVQKSLADLQIGKASSLDELEQLRVRFIGRNGPVTELLKQLKDLSVEDKRELGPLIQSKKAELDQQIEARRRQLEDEADAKQSAASALDLTLPAYRPPRGRLHPLTQTMNEMTRILSLMGFSWAEGPLVEDDYHNFTALNIPEHHSARDMQDTFYLQGMAAGASTPLLLRTHTSGVQIRVMEGQRPPVRIMAPGRVFRHEAVDATHSAVFHRSKGSTSTRA